MNDTKQRILDTAERLIAEKGYAATSLRHIIGEAGVNLAAVHYHFGSKEELLDAVVMRRAAAVNEERLARLERYAAESGGVATVEQALEAFLLPMAEAANQHPQFVRLMGRLIAEGLLPGLLQRVFHNVVTRLVDALRQALPHLSEEELQWRIRFMQGAMAHTMCCAAPAGDFEARMRLLIRFLSGGLRAPAAAAEAA